jgi:hypothetical protein
MYDSSTWRKWRPPNNHDMINAFPADRTDQPFCICVLPGWARRCRAAEDAMIGATALIEADIPVTNDNSFKRCVALDRNVKALSSDEFSSFLSSLSTDQ